ncbi:MAG: hypothetical protein OEV55_08790 [candidate division Zixibacteria bacterium]|nr:hypothetical protein [candidate division Zixibacteria bacterium]
MHIVSLDIGKFPELSGLDIFLGHSELKLKLVLDIFLPKEKGFDFEKIYRTVASFLPNLNKHKCWARLLGGSAPRGGKKDLHFQSIGGITDIAHLTEHMIIDLQATIGQMETCSGLTCGYQDPANRFDLFIECHNSRVATFSSFLAVKMMKELLWKGSLSNEYLRTIQLAKYLNAEPELMSSLNKLSHKLNCQKDELILHIKELIDLKFLNKDFLLSVPHKKEK